MNFRYPTIEETLENELWKNHFIQKYGFQFFQPSFDKVPYVSSLFNEDKIVNKFRDIEDYLLFSYPINMGTNNHLNMHKIRHSFSDEEYSKFQQINKLGVNRWGNFIGKYWSLLELNLDNQISLTSPFLLFEPENYDKLSFSSKINGIRHLDLKIYNLLEKIYEKYS